MICSTDRKAATREFCLRFGRRAEEQRVPLEGGITLTNRCNLVCVHCYIPEDDRRRTSADLPARFFHQLIEDATAAGCLFLFLTGGEPLLRKDFAELYRHARSNGMIVTVLTNGTLIDESVTGVFEEYPPHVVEVTAYGATEETYEQVTRVKGSFRRFQQGIENLHQAGIRFALKTVLMKENLRECGAIEAMAERYGVQFRFDPAIFPRFDGDRAPVLHRVEPHEAVKQELARKTMREGLKSCLERQEGSLEDTLFNCGAGRTAFHVDAGGRLLPCLMVPHLGYDLQTVPFSSGWERMEEHLNRRVSRSVCRQCPHRKLCDRCPGFFRLDTGSDETVSEFLCELGRLRREGVEADIAAGV